MIKVKGWHVSKKRMFSCEELVRDQLTLLADGRFINVSGVGQKLSIIFPRDKFIPIEYTGLKDKHGKEIYEGDIVAKQCDHRNYEVSVSYDGKFFPNHPDNVKSFIVEPQVALGFLPIDMPDRLCSKWEIIGNIYENPELLEAK